MIELPEQDQKLKDAIEAVLNGVTVREAERLFAVPASSISQGVRALKLFDCKTFNDWSSREAHRIGIPPVQTRGYSLLQVVAGAAAACFFGVVEAVLVWWFFGR